MDQIREICSRETKSLKTLQIKLLKSISQCEKRAHEIRLMESLPIPSAIQVAKSVIKMKQSHLNVMRMDKKQIEESTAYIQFIRPMLLPFQVKAVLRSAIGVVPHDMR